MNKKSAKLISECSELIQAIYKAERHGWGNWHPRAKAGIYNIDDVEHEIADVEKAIKELKGFIARKRVNQ
jgi:NTP pyrophosphatase (non-canonical NTP hydrolase)